ALGAAVTSRHPIIFQLEKPVSRKLYPSRRSGVPRREPRVPDHTKSGAAGRGDPARLAQVRVVEPVEGRHAELQARGPVDLRVLDDRQVGVGEPRTVDRVASEVPEV